MPLSLVGVGESFEVVGIYGGGRADRKFADMGFVPGAKGRVVYRQDHGPILVELKGSRLALGRGMAGRIMTSGGER